MKNKNSNELKKEDSVGLKKEDAVCPLYTYAKQELELAGLLNSDSEWDRWVARDVLKLIKVFSKQGHSGFSAITTLNIFNKVARFENLTPLSSNPDEWMKIAHDTWQSRRNPSCFSHDGGKTFYNINEKLKRKNIINKIITFLKDLFRWKSK
jgi:hypothetical protein